MRVGLVCPYSLDVPGGVQNHVLGLAGMLRQLGHEVSVLAPGSSDHEYVVPAGRSLPLPYNGSVSRVTFGPGAAARVTRWLGAGGFDVVHVHEPLTPSLSLLAVRASRVPVVATYHTSQERARALTVSATVARRWLDRIDAHVAVSSAAARTMRRYLRVHAQVVPNGLHVGALGGQSYRDGRTVLFLGRIDERRKGLHVLLDAWPAIRAARPDLRLLVAGPGRRPELPAGVRVLGEVGEAEKAVLLRCADLLVAPNTHGESFGIVLAEAMAAGTPVLASDLPAFRDVLGDGRFGTIFDGDLAGALLSVMGDAEHRFGLAAAASREVRRFDWSVVAPQVVAVYDELLAPEAVAG